MLAKLGEHPLKLLTENTANSTYFKSVIFKTNIYGNKISYPVYVNVKSITQHFQLHKRGQKQVCKEKPKAVGVP